MKKYFVGLISFFTVILVIFGNGEKVYASGGEEVITITIDAGDGSSGLLYAIDSDAPESFRESNTFTVAEGSSHTIYVKDAEGNIASQVYEYRPTSTEKKEEELNIELSVGNSGTSSKYGYQENMNYEYMTDTKIDNSDANVISKITTDGSDLAEKVFYVITTEEGEEFYLVIEQGDSNKVHLLNTVTLDDLTALAEEGSEKSKEPDNLLAALTGGTDTAMNSDNVENESQSDISSVPPKSNNMFLYILIAIGGGGYYYFKIYKNKKNESMDVMDAMDMDEFSMEEEEDEEDLELDEKEKDELLSKLIRGEYEDDEELQNMSPDEYVEKEDFENEEVYATSHKEEMVIDSEPALEMVAGEEEKIDYLPEMDSEIYDEELDGEEDDE